MNYINLSQVLELHRRVLLQSGGSSGVRDQGAVESAIAQPTMTFGGQELYPSLEEKAAAPGFSLLNNHPFIDGNKRIGHAAMEFFLARNGYEISAPVDEQETFVLRLAAGEASREELVEWLRAHLVTLD
ncbi:MAG TPA: type II toxin-antitoxin system death-on-curing family toxin [Abditibacteriaceae bacterium]|jgi:death-on-curing protein